MVDNIWNEDIVMSTDWGGDESTNNLPVSGEKVQKFIKEQLQSNKADIDQLRTDTETDISQLETSTEESIGQLRTETETNLSQASSTLQSSINQVQQNTTSSINQLSTNTNTALDELRAEIASRPKFVVLSAEEWQALQSSGQVQADVLYGIKESSVTPTPSGDQAATIDDETGNLILVGSTYDSENETLTVIGEYNSETGVLTLTN